MSADDAKGFARIKSDIEKFWYSFSLKVIVFLLVFVISLSAMSWLFGDANKAMNAASSMLASMMVVLKRGDGNLNYFTETGERVRYQANRYKTIPALKNGRDHLASLALYGGFASTAISLLAVVLFSRAVRTYKSPKSKKKEHLRGASYVEPEELEELVRARNDVSEFSLGELPIPASVIDRHLYLSGDTGNGKSQLLMQILDVVRALDEKVIILDKNGEMLSRFYDEDKDYILGPFDDRSQNWTTYCEGNSEVDFEKIARSFIPTPPPGRETHWVESAVNVFSVLLDQLSTSSDHSRAVEELYSKLIESKKVVEENLLGRPEIVTKRGVFDLVKGTIAQLSVDEAAPEHASSVISSLIPNIRSLNYLRGLGDRPIFSIKDWVKNPNDRGWLFIRVSEDYFELVEPLIRTWLDTAIKAVLSLKKPNNYRVWFVVDELQSLKAINSLKKGLHEGRGHGLRCILGFTSVHELFDSYGEHTAKGMLGQCVTKASFAVSEPSAAEWNAKLLGSEEVIRENESSNFGRQHSHSSNEQLHESNIVMPSQLQTLPRFHAYVKFSGDWPVTKIKTKFKDRLEVAPYSVERALPPAFRVLDKEKSTNAPRAPKGAAVIQQEFQDGPAI